MPLFILYLCVHFVVVVILGVFRYDTRFLLEAFLVEKINKIRTNNTGVETLKAQKTKSFTYYKDK